MKADMNSTVMIAKWCYMTASQRAVVLAKRFCLQRHARARDNMDLVLMSKTKSQLSKTIWVHT